MILSDEAGRLNLTLNAAARVGDRLCIEVVAVDGAHRWGLSAPLLSVDEAAELGAWLAGLPGDLTLGADEWTALTFASPVFSIAGRRIPGGVVELRVSVLGMTELPAADGDDRHRTTDVVLGLRLPADDVERAAVAFATETAALRD